MDAAWPGGNEACALLTVMGTTLTSWFLTTAWLSVLTGAEVELNIADMMLQLVLGLVVPVIIGQLVQRIPTCARFADRHKMPLGLVSQLLILAIVVKASAIVGEKLHADRASEVPLIVLTSRVLCGDPARPCPGGRHLFLRLS